MDSSQNSTHEQSTVEEKKTSRRPANTAFRQQRLKAWQPILTPKNVIWIFLVLGVFAAVVGGLLIYASRMISYIEIDYTDCGAQAGSDFSAMPSDLVKSYWRNNNGSINVDAQWNKTEDVTYTYGNVNVSGLSTCGLQFKIVQDMGAPVRAYYHLDNFYQNHRRYVSSFNADQLVGKSVSTSTLQNSNCPPLATEDVDENGEKKTLQIYPCGLIANSLFNDTIGRPVVVGVEGTPEERTYKWSEEDIAWSSDKDLYEPLTNPDYSLITPPPNWIKRYPDGYSDKTPPPNLKTDEHFISWMRTAALPSFFKPWAFGNTTLVAGTYQINIVDNFNMTAYKGRKSLVITTTGPLGGKNDLPGILWLALAGFFIVMSLLFVAGSFLRPRKLGDHTLLSWNKVAPSAAAKGKGKAPAGPSIGMSTSRDL
ncbi:CDC50 family protein [Xylaria sp. FL1777]|nr:CDC50 family protein [Xylaria sp. FL1777]